MEQNQDVQSFAETSRLGLREKADHNKHESLRTFMAVIICTLGAPMFITLGPGFWTGKVIPSLLSLIAAGATAWLQQRKPQQLWALYRGAQREIEDQQTKRKFLIAEYNGAASPDKILAERVAEILLNVHYQWLPIVPTVDNLVKVQKGREALKSSDVKHDA